MPVPGRKIFEKKYNINREDLNATPKGFLVKTETVAQVEGLLKMNTLVSVSCTVTKHSFCNESRGLIYIKEYDIDELQSFKNGIMERYNVKEVIPATWITPKSFNSMPFLPTFNNHHISAYQVKGKPLRYTTTNRSRYSAHTASNTLTQRRDAPNTTRYPVCSEEHPKQQCEVTSKCRYCQEAHKVADSRCPVHKENEEICSIQNEENISWKLAKQRYF